MSRIGKLPVAIPDGTTVKVGGDKATVTVKGPKGQLQQTLPMVEVNVEGARALVKTLGESREHRACHGLSRALLNNMVIGCSQGHKRVLMIVGTGYKADASGQKLLLNLGFSHQIEYVLPKGISVAIAERGQRIELEGADKEALGQAAANIRGFRPPEPYKGKGVQYLNEVVRRKAGKAGK
jgi:large subunit ribosomal protein L6